MDLLANSFESSATPLRATFDRESPLRAASVEMNLTDLKPEGCDYSIGDISPIQFVYSHTSQQDTPAEKPSPPLNPPYPAHQQHNPFYVIRCFANFFRKFKYTLPCLHGIGLPIVNLSTFSPLCHVQTTASSASEVDTKIAIRRVEAAVCAFGGTVQDYRRHAQSIFRLRDRVAADTRVEYEKALVGRYYVSGSRLSWEFEENPPVMIPSEDCEQTAPSSHHQSVVYKLTNSPSTRASSLNRPQSSPSSTSSVQSSDTRHKYRCKLCGQIKNNHLCPYRQPMQRSIGIMVYPAVNSFTAFEPGTVAPPLTKMNNFVSYDSDYSGPPRHDDHRVEAHGQRNMESFVSAEPTVGVHHSDSTSHHNHHHHHHQQQQQQQHSLFHSPQSSLSSHEENHHYLQSYGTHGSHNVVMNPRKRPREPHDDRKTPFVASVALGPEHYRAVTPSETPASYSYPAVPLTFMERKRLSDTLFHFSKEIPHLTAECATVLRLAREHDDWDLAVAELLTQVLVGLYCHKNDTRLDGLSEYLLALGVSC
jgi:hypothetical protein